MEEVLKSSSFNSSSTISQNDSCYDEERKRIMLGGFSNNFIEENDKCIVFNITGELERYNTEKYETADVSFNSFTSYN